MQKKMTDKYKEALEEILSRFIPNVDQFANDLDALVPEAYENWIELCKFVNDVLRD
jgi:hypothetical protein